MGILPYNQIQKHLAAGEFFADAGEEAVVRIDIRGIISNGIEPVFPSKAKIDIILFPAKENFSWFSEKASLSLLLESEDSLLFTVKRFKL